VNADDVIRLTIDEWHEVCATLNAWPTRVYAGLPDTTD
jgi:hypothetical protein